MRDSAVPLELDPPRGSFLAPPVRDRAWTLSASPKRDRSGSGSILVSSRRRRAGGKVGNIPMFSTFPRASPESSTQLIALLKKGGKSPPTDCLADHIASYGCVVCHVRQ